MNARPPFARVRSNRFAAVLRPRAGAQRPRAAAARSAGFTLIEIAIALMIMGLIAVGIVSTISQQTEQRRYAETRGLLEKARESLLAFVTVNGRLPCPATAASAGHESIAAVAGNTITCTAEVGLLPAVSLGIGGLEPGGWLNNAWRDGGAGMATLPRTIRYGVSTLAAPVASALTSPGLGATAANAATRRTDVQTALTAGQGLFVCSSLAGIGVGANRCGGDPNTLAKSVAAFVWSLGPNGNQPLLFSADEQQNAAMTVPRVLISRVVAPPGATGGMFDDQLSWLPFSLVADRLVALGYVQ